VDAQYLPVSCVCEAAGLAKSIGQRKVGQREKDLRLGKEILWAYTLLWLIQTRCYFSSPCQTKMKPFLNKESDCFAYLCERFPALSIERLKARIFDIFYSP